MVNRVSILLQREKVSCVRFGDRSKEKRGAAGDCGDVAAVARVQISSSDLCLFYKCLVTNNT